MHISGLHYKETKIMSISTGLVWKSEAVDSGDIQAEPSDLLVKHIDLWNRSEREIFN